MKGEPISLKKNVLCFKGYNQERKKNTKWEKIFVSYRSKRLIYRNYMEFLQLNNKNQFKNGQKI